MNTEHNTIPQLLDRLPYAELAHDGYQMTDEGSSSDTALLLRGNEPFAVFKVDRLWRSLSYVESLVLATLNDAAVNDPPPIKLPAMIESQAADVPCYGIYSYVAGATLSYPDMLALSNSNKIAIGRQLAEAVYWTEQHLSVDVVPELDMRNRPQSHMERLDYLRHCKVTKGLLLHDGYDFYVHALLDTLERVDDQFDDAYLQSALCGHNELLDVNITFDVRPESVALRGIFDFGMAGRRPTEYDFRIINFLSPYYTQGALERYYELSGRELDADKIDTWSDIQVLGPLVYRAINTVQPEGRYAWYLEHFIKRSKAARS